MTTTAANTENGAIIGITGVARSGKDTTGQVLVRDWGFEQHAFADRLKQVAWKINPYVGFQPAPKKKWAWTPADNEGIRLRDHIWNVGKELAKDNPEVRRLYQVIGTEVGREMFGDNFWVDQLLDQYQWPARWVITDVRFPNEADAIRHRGGYIIRVERPGVTAANGHVSEHAMANYRADHTIHNNGGILELSDQVNDFVNEHDLT